MAGSADLLSSSEKPLRSEIVKAAEVRSGGEAPQSRRGSKGGGGRGGGVSSGGRSFKHFSRREWLTLFALGSVHFGGSLCVALQAPFYPSEAEKKGASATEYGLVFGVFELTSFISSPFFGKYMDVMGAKRLLTIGMFVAAISSICFGLIDLIEGHIPFIALSFVIRAVEALGSSAAVTAAFSITASVFSDSVATTFATLEVFYGFGYIVGPSVGGFLNSLGGYIVPFVVMGTLLLLDVVFVTMVLPALPDTGVPASKGKLIGVLRVPAVLLDTFAIMCTAASMGFLSATLEPHLRVFELSPSMVGLVFVVSGGTYAVTAPLVGRLCDRRVAPRSLMLLGSCCIIVSYLLVGPAPFIQAEPMMPAIIVGLLIHGLGVANILVPCFVDALRSAVAHGFPDDITTHGLVSGLWASSFALGDFIGPSVAGALFDAVGFRLGTFFIIGLHLLVLTALSSFLCCTKWRVPAPAEECPDLPLSPRSASPAVGGGDGGDEDRSPEDARMSSPGDRSSPLTIAKKGYGSNGTLPSNGSLYGSVGNTVPLRVSA